MKFKKEDIGLYVIMSVIGSGIGLLVGSQIASRKASKTRYEVLEEPVEDEPEEEVVKKELSVFDTMGDDELIEYQMIVDTYLPSKVQQELFSRGLVTLEEFADAAKNNGELFKEDPNEPIIEYPGEGEAIGDWLVTDEWEGEDGEYVVPKTKYSFDGEKFYKRTGPSQDRFIPATHFASRLPEDVVELINTHLFDYNWDECILVYQDSETWLIERHEL